MASTSQPYYIISPLHPHQNRCDAAKTTAWFRGFFNHSFSVSSVAPLKQVTLHHAHLISDECQCCVLIKTFNFLYIYSYIYIYQFLFLCGWAAVKIFFQDIMPVKQTAHIPVASVNICQKIFRKCLQSRYTRVPMMTHIFLKSASMSVDIWYKHPSVFCCRCFLSLSQDTPSPPSIWIQHTRPGQNQPRNTEWILELGLNVKNIIIRIERKWMDA